MNKNEMNKILDSRVMIEMRRVAWRGGISVGELLVLRDVSGLLVLTMLDKTKTLC